MLNWRWGIAAAMAALLAYWAGSYRSASRGAGETAWLEAENARLRMSLAKPAAAPPAAPAAAPSAQGRETPPEAASAHSLTDVRTIVQLQAKLAENATALAQLETRVQELAVQARRLESDNQRLTASETDLKDELSTANRLIDAQQRELKGKSDRLGQLEIALQKMREDASASGRKQAEYVRLAAELEAAHRRRE